MYTKLAIVAIAAFAGVKAEDALLSEQGAVWASCTIGEPESDGLWGQITFKQHVDVDDTFVGFADTTFMRARFFGLDPEVSYTLKMEE